MWEKVGNMTIIRKGVNKIGTAWSKKINAVDITADGAEVIIHAQIIPMYVYPGQIWCSWTAVDTSAAGSEVDPWVQGEYKIYGRFVNIDSADRLASWNSSTAEILEYVNINAPIDEDQIISDTASATDVGVTGATDAVMPAQFKRSLFLDREYNMSLSENSYPTNANKIRFAVKGNYRGDVRTSNFVDVSQPKLLVISAMSSTAEVSQNESQVLSGGLEIEALYEALVANIPGRNDTTSYVTDDVMNANLAFWLTHGYSEDIEGTVFAGKVMRTVMRVTTRMDVYEPAPRNVILSP